MIVTFNNNMLINSSNNDENNNNEMKATINHDPVSPSLPHSKNSVNAYWNHFYSIFFITFLYKFLYYHLILIFSVPKTTNNTSPTPNFCFLL